ncbi:MAG: integrase arm-type DNA-binding domain-containing protein [Hyphomicrobiales bacterium]|nr:integrase arm-type DNA-binding domain-containing protein [Hyphomicrobiales bacterium]
MPRVKLNDAKVKALKPPLKPLQVETFDTLFPALAIRVSYSGARTWVLHKRIGGKLKRLTLGRYPALSLAGARRKAREWTEYAQRGRDPAAEAAERDAATYSAAVERFLDGQANWLRPRTLEEYKRVLQGAGVAAWGAKPLGRIARADVVALLDKIDQRGHRSAVNHTFSYLRIFFNWCVDRDLIERAPTERMKARHPAPSRDRVLSADDLALVLAALDDDGALRVLYGLSDLPDLSDPMRNFVRLLILTGQRRAEVAGMAWAEISDPDGGEPQWQIPAARTKNHRDHIVPLAPSAAAVLRHRAKARRAGDAMVFGKTGEAPLSGFSRAKANLDARIAAVAAAQGKKAPAPWTWHDLRRTMVTAMNEKLGIAPHIVEAAVNHISGAAKAGVAGTYNRAIYLSERREALARWAAYLEEALA